MKIIGITALIASAYALSFALDLLLGGITGFYPGTVFLPVVTWSIISTVLLLLTCSILKDRRISMLPFFALGMLAAIGGYIGHHHHSYGVALLLFIQSGLIWKA